MATGDKHDAISITVGLIVGGVSMMHLPIALSLGIVGGGYLGLWLSPDLDQSDTAWGSNSFHRWKKLGLSSWWAAYGKLSHRNWASHAPILSTLFRWVYLWPVSLPLVVFALGHTVAGLSLLGLFIGNAIADTAHWAMDGMKLYRFPEGIFKWFLGVGLFALGTTIISNLALEVPWVAR